MAASLPRYNDNINLLLVGKTGNGKSSTGNSILGKKVFVSKSSTTSVTFEPQFETSVIDGQTVSVMDVPGLSDTQFDQEENVTKVTEWMNKAMRLSDRGFHAVVLVIRFGTRFTEEDRESIKLLKSILGDRIIRDHSVCAITCGDNFQSDVDNGEIGSFKEWCAQQSGAFLDLFNECSQRCVLFDNVSKDCEIQKTQRNELIREVTQLQELRFGTFSVREFENVTRIRENKTPRNEFLVQPRINVLGTDELPLTRYPFVSQRKSSETRHHGFCQQWQTDVLGGSDEETSNSDNEEYKESKRIDRNEYVNPFISQRGLNSWRYQYPLAQFMDSDNSSSDGHNGRVDSDKDDDSDDDNDIDKNNHDVDSVTDDSDNDNGIYNNSNQVDSVTDDSDSNDGIDNNNYDEHSVSDDSDSDDGVDNNEHDVYSVTDDSDSIDGKDNDNDIDEDSDDDCGNKDNEEVEVEDEDSLDESARHNQVEDLLRHIQSSNRVERHECTLL